MPVAGRAVARGPPTKTVLGVSLRSWRRIASNAANLLLASVTTAVLIVLVRAAMEMRPGKPP